MELQFYHSTTPATNSWASLRFPSRETNDTAQGYRKSKRQRTSDCSYQMECPRLRRYSTENLVGNNSPFSESKDCRSLTMNHVVIPEPNRVYTHHTRESSPQEDRYWANKAAFLDQDENGFTPPLLVTGNNKFHRVSDKTTEVSLHNSYKYSRKPMDIAVPPPCKKRKGSADSRDRDEETTSAFKVFKRNDNTNQFSRINERNRNLPPPPPLIKTNAKMRKNSKAREQIIVIHDPPPPPRSRPEKCQSDSRHPLRASTTIPHETLHQSKPISSTRVNTMEYQQPMDTRIIYHPRDERTSIEVVRNQYHYHHYDNHSTQFPNSRNNRISHRETPLSITREATRSHYVPHTGIPSHSDYHNGISTANPTSGFNKNHRSASHKLLNCPSPTRIASSRSFCDTHEAFRAGRQRCQLTASSNVRENDCVVVPRQNSKKCSGDPRNSYSPSNLEISRFKEPRLCEDHERTTIHEMSLRLCHQNKNLSFPIDQTIQQSPKNDHGKLRRSLQMHSHSNNTQQSLTVTHKPLPHHVKHLNVIQLLPDIQSPGASSPSGTQISKHTPKHLSMSLSSNSQVNGSDKVAVFSKLSELAPTPPSRRPSSSPTPFFCCPETRMGKSQNEVIVQAKKVPCILPNRDCLSFSNGETKYQENNSRKPISPQPKAFRCPPILDPQILDGKETPKETEDQSAMPSQPTVPMSPAISADKASIKQINQLVMLRSSQKPRRLSYPLEKSHFNQNRSKINPSGPLRRTVSEDDKKPQCDTEVTKLPDTSRDVKNAPRSCGGYAFDHDSLPIIVAVHSIMVKHDKPTEIESSQEEETKGETPKEFTVTTSSHCTETTISISKNEHNSYQRSILPKPNTSKHSNLSTEIKISGENQDMTIPSESTTSAMDDKPVNPVSMVSYDDNKQMTKTLNSVKVSYPNKLFEDKEDQDQATRAQERSVKICNAAAVTSTGTKTSANECSQSISNSGYEEIEEKVKTPKYSLHRKQSVEELSNKIVETIQRIDKEKIEWKKKLLRRLEFVLRKKLKKAEKDTGVKSSINLPPEGKEEQKKAKNWKRIKSCGDEPCAKVEQAEKDLKEKCEDRTQKESDHKHYDEVKHKVFKRKSKDITKNTISELGNSDEVYHAKNTISELGNCDEVYRGKNTSKKVGEKIPTDIEKMSKKEIDVNINDETISNIDGVPKASVNDKKDQTITGNYNESVLFPNYELESDINTGLDYCDLVIDE